MQRSSIEAASNFVSRNRLPTRLKEQILGYMCLRFKAENLNQFQLIEQLPNSIYKSICQHLFLPTVENVYLFRAVTRKTLLLLVSISFILASILHFYIQHDRVRFCIWILVDIVCTSQIQDQPLNCVSTFKDLIPLID